MSSPVLPSARPKRTRGQAARQPAASLPVARVAVDISLPHLDRPFDYLVPDSMADSAVPGSQVRVRFAGQLVGGFVLERRASTDHQGRLGFLARVVSPEPVLTAEVAGLARAVADRYGGTMADVLRLAIPPRHARAARSALLAAGSAPSVAGSDPSVAGSDPSVAGSAPAGAGSDPVAGSDPSVAGRDPSVPGSAPPASRGEEPAITAGTGPQSLSSGAEWQRYRDGQSFLAALAEGRSPRAVWSALPGPSWPAEIAQAAAAVTRSGRGALVVVPDARDLGRIDTALAAALGAGQHVVLAASVGPAERYRRWLAVARGSVRVVAGTRAAMFAPVADLGLVVLWDEGNDLHAEQRAPYPNAREVLTLRAHRARSAALIGGYARTAEAAQLLGTGWARPLAPDRRVVRAAAPAVRPAGGDEELARDEAARSARLPSLALRTTRSALADGPVLFQVPRRGYLTAVACERCHSRTRCSCGGPAQLPAPGAVLRCGWCGSPVDATCSACGHRGVRAVVTGARRTAEELGRAFAPAPVITSGGSEVLDRVGSDPAVVVATPGAEPVADGGYAAAVLLDGWAMLGAATLRAAEEALRRWMAAASLVRPAGQGGRVVVVADAGQPAVQALIRWDPATFADRELADREQLRFPPAVRMGAISGPAAAVQSLLAAAALPGGAELLGPLPERAAGAGRPPGDQPPGEPELIRYLVRVPRSEGTALAVALRAGQAARSAAKEPGAVRVQLDPAALI